MKNKLIKTLLGKISITEILHFEEKETVKTISEGAIHEYILAFSGWQSIFLGSGGWWWMHCGYWWVVVGGGGYILASGGCWWVEWWMVVGGSIV